MPESSAGTMFHLNTFKVMITAIKGIKEIMGLGRFSGSISITFALSGSVKNSPFSSHFFLLPK